MATSKVINGNQVILDLQGDTISPETVLAGYIGHNSKGEQFEGTSTAIVPTGTLPITENDTYDVSQYANVDVNVPSGGSSYTLGNLYMGFKTTLDEEDFMFDDGSGTPTAIPQIGRGMYNGLFAIENVVIPEGVELIDGESMTGATAGRVSECFAGLGIYTEGCSVSFPESLTSIATAFNGFYNDMGEGFAVFIPTVQIPANCEIVWNSFNEGYIETFEALGATTALASVCNNQSLLISVEIGADILDISGSFSNCPALETFTIHATTPPQFDGYIDTTSLQAIYVPASAVTDYQQDANWANYAAYIQAIPEN